MPRTRLVWHLFAGWCALVAVILTACFWMASVHMARLSDEAQRQRVVAAAAAVSHGMARGETDGASLAALARDASGSDRIEVVVVPDGDAAGADTPRGVAQGANEGGLLAAARAGRTAAASRYDAASGRRLLTVAAPHVATGRPAGVILVTADTGESDDRLRRAQRNLLFGHLACAAAAAAAGFLLARRAALPLRSLAASASRLAAGDVDVPLPSADLVEVADLATAFGALRERIVESGITIGRQGTQQEAVLGSMIEGVLAIDARQRIVGLNRAAADLLGLDPGAVVRRPLQEVVRNPDLRRFALLAIDCRAPVEDDLVLHGLRDRTIRLRGTALRDSSGEGGAVIVLNDVTEMQRLEMVRRDFVANVSHELKTPVASIKGFVETLLDGAADDPDDNRRFLGIIAKQSDRLAAIIEDLLALSRIEQSEDSGTLPVEPTPLAEVLAAAAADCALRAEDRGIELHAGSADDLVARVNAPLLEQAVINLVDNAIKHSEPGRSVWISATAAGEGDLMIQVRDEGCGIAPEHLPRLFERFYRVDKARSRRLGGTGLGLSIVKHIVQAHGGTVTVESASGEGSTFTIRMPLRPGAE